MDDEPPLAIYPHVGTFRVIPQMANFSRTPGGLRRPAPRIGEHNAEVIAEVTGRGDHTTKAG